MLLLCSGVPDVRDPGPMGHLHISLDFSQLYMTDRGLLLYSKNQSALLTCILQTGDKKEQEGCWMYSLLPGVVLYGPQPSAFMNRASSCAVSSHTLSLYEMYSLFL